jgi:hypothetical protein
LVASASGQTGFPRIRFWYQSHQVLVFPGRPSRIFFWNLTWVWGCVCGGGARRNTRRARNTVSLSIRRNTRKFPSPLPYGRLGNQFRRYGGMMAAVTAVEKLKKWVADNL